MKVTMDLDDESILLKVFGRRNPIIRVIDFLLDNEGFEYSKSEIARNIGVSRTTLYKVWRLLEDLNIVVKTREVGRVKMYKLNKKNPIVRKLIELDDVISEYYSKNLMRN